MNKNQVVKVLGRATISNLKYKVPMDFAWLSAEGLILLASMPAKTKLD